jgi:hypothetical protein
MTLPGVSVSIRDEAAPPAFGFDTGAAFVVGVTGRGPLAVTAVRSITGFANLYGERDAENAVLYDWLDVFFREGGSLAYVRRIVGAGSAESTITVPHAGSGDPTAFQVDASSPGIWGDDLDVVVAAGTSVGTFKLTVKLDGTIVESSPDLGSNDDAVAWSEGSTYVALTKLGEDAPTNGTYSLAGGDDDHGSIIDADFVDALDDFTTAYGPGQVVIPGQTTDAIHVGLVEHVADRGRVCLLDVADSAVVADLVGDLDAVRGYRGARFAAAFGPWAIVPGVLAGTTRKVPYSAVEAGRIAALDAASQNPNQAAAGAAGVAQDPWDDEDRATLNDAGFNVARDTLGRVQAYGYRTIVNPVTDPRWREFTGSRTVMAVLADSHVVGESFEFSQLDGRGVKIAEFGGALTAVCAGYYQRGALYGATAEDAFSVNVSDAVNTPESLANGELKAVLTLRTSPFAERVEVELVRRLPTETV